MNPELLNLLRLVQADNKERPAVSTNWRGLLPAEMVQAGRDGLVQIKLWLSRDGDDFWKVTLTDKGAEAIRAGTVGK